MKKIAVLVETTGVRAAATVKSGSTVFSVPPQQRAVCTAEEFCVQIHAIKLVEPQQYGAHNMTKLFKFELCKFELLTSVI